MSSACDRSRLARRPCREAVAAPRGGQGVRLVAVGSIGLDAIETPFARREDLLGGSLSFACAAASFFAPVGMVGVVGDDFPQRHLARYRRFGIDLQGLARAQGKTFRWSGIYDADMINRRTLSTELNVFQAFSPQIPAAYRRAPFLLLGNISPELQLRVLAQMERPRFVAADTMDLWINTAREGLLRVIRRANLLTLNDGEARLLAGRHNLRDCAETIAAWGPQYVVIKKGEHGAMLVSRSGVFLAPAYPVRRLHDPTGAGDAFAGGLMGMLAGRRQVTERAVRAALLYGSVVASFGVEDFSIARLERLTRRDIEERLAELKRMIRAG
jgi:sugar/nucleoside kinase (ribokinase family)